MDLDGGVIHNEGRLKRWALKSRLFLAKNSVNFCFVFQQNWEEEAPLYNLDNQVGEQRKRNK